MCELRAEAARWVDDKPQPDLVEVQFTDAYRHAWPVVEKTARFGFG